VEVNRNNSSCTLLPGVMLDLVDEDPAPYFHTVTQWQTSDAQKKKTQQALLAETPESHAKRFAPTKSEGEAANRLFDALRDAQLTNPRWAATDGRRVYTLLMRWYWTQYNDAYPHVGKRLAARLGTCFYQAGQYTQWEAMQRLAGVTPARDIEKSLRWDTVTASNSGREYDILTTHLAGKTASSNAGAKDGQPTTNIR